MAEGEALGPYAPGPLNLNPVSGFRVSEACTLNPNPSPKSKPPRGDDFEPCALHRRCRQHTLGRRRCKLFENPLALVGEDTVMSGKKIRSPKPEP